MGRLKTKELVKIVLFTFIFIGIAYPALSQISEPNLIEPIQQLWKKIGPHIFNTNPGNVGIGTNTPTEKLTVVGGNIEILENGTNRGGKVFYDPLSNVFGIKASPAGNSPLSFGTGGYERVFIDANGNVGIGTNTPGALLDVAGLVNAGGFSMPVGAANGYVLTSDAAGTASWQPAPVSGGNVNASGTPGALPKFTSPAQLGDSVITESNGNIGIGTTFPNAKLEVNGGIRLNTSDSKPLCDEGTRGMFWFEKNIPVDAVSVCMRSVHDNITLLTVSLPQQNNALSCVNTLSGKAYCFGGSTGGFNLGNILEYDVVVNTLSIKSVLLPSPRYALSCAYSTSITNKVYCFGGLGPGPLDQIFEYSPLTNQLFVKSAILPLPQYALSCVESSSTNKIYCFGGSATGDQILQYDVVNDILTIKSAKLPSSRYWLSCAESLDMEKIYCFGGITGAVYTDQIIEYDPVQDVISIMNSTLPIPLSSLSCARHSADSHIYCFGGLSNGGLVFDTILQFNPSADKLVTQSAVLPSPRESLSCIGDNLTNKTYCFGGRSGQNVFDDIISYDYFTDFFWTKIA